MIWIKAYFPNLSLLFLLLLCMLLVLTLSFCLGERLLSFWCSRAIHEFLLLFMLNPRFINYLCFEDLILFFILITFFMWNQILEFNIGLNHRGNFAKIPLAQLFVLCLLLFINLISFLYLWLVPLRTWDVVNVLVWDYWSIDWGIRWWNLFVL